MEKNYRMSVIEADTAVETLLSNILQKHYNLYILKAANKIPLNEILELRIDETKPYLNLISNTITSGKEWTNWKTKCHRLRNDVVHKRKTPETSEAQEALSSSKAFLELLKDFLYDESDWILEGKAYIHDRKIAKEYFKKSITKNPNPTAYYYLGNIEYDAQQYDDARKYFQEALNLAGHAFFYYNIGNCDVAQHLYPNAIKNYDHAISLKIELHDPYNNPYYQKYRVLTEQNLNHTAEDIITLFNVLLNGFPHHAYLLFLRAKYA